MADKKVQLKDKDGNDIYPVSTIPANTIVGTEVANISASDLNNLANLIKPIVLSQVYPIGSIYTSINDINPNTFIGGTWESIGAGRCLMGVDSSHAAGTTTEAGLPNITGEFAHDNNYGTYWGDSVRSNAATQVGAFYAGTQTSSSMQSTSGGDGYRVAFDASRSNPIYGRSTTVQPPTYNVYFWRRTA